jgi:hypothetical protein
VFGPAGVAGKQGISSRKKLLEVWKITLMHVESFWNSWRRDYLLMLRERTQWKHAGPRAVSRLTPVEGTVVYVEKPGAPRNAWDLARIVECNRGRDGAIRSAVVKMGRTNNLITRPISKLYPLEVPMAEQRQPQPEPPAPEAEEDVVGQPEQALDLSRGGRVPTAGRRYNLRPRGPNGWVLAAMVMGQKAVQRSEAGIELLDPWTLKPRDEPDTDPGEEEGIETESGVLGSIGGFFGRVAAFLMIPGGSGPSRSPPRNCTRCSVRDPHLEHPPHGRPCDCAMCPGFQRQVRENPAPVPPPNPNEIRQ